jgi:O6-methylguanine-DNA--protein-cysteine methyltransferase
MTKSDVVAELQRVVNQIPVGKAMSYGAVGDHMVPRQTGRAVGRLLANFSESAAWWRVVRRDGYLSTYARGPLIGNDQRQRLMADGVTILDDTVSGECMIWELPN